MNNTDAVIYKSTTNGRGGIRTTTKVNNNQLNNFFQSVSFGEAVIGSTVYWGGYLVNAHDSFDMSNLVLYIDPNTEHPDDEVQIGWEPLPADSTYHYYPYFNANGSNYVEVADSSTLHQTDFALAAWFRTSATYTSEGMIVCKGRGFGDDTPGQNLNYGIWIRPTDHRIGGGFEQDDGTDHHAITPSGTAYNDGQWHLAVCTYDYSNVEIWIDGALKASHSTSTDPQSTTTNPLRIGANSGAEDRFFTGQIDEVRLWSADLFSGDIINLYTKGTVGSISKLKYENTFGGNIPEMQTIATINTAPVGVEFLPAPSYNQGAFHGKLRHQEGRGFWLKRILNPTREDLARNSFFICAGWDPPEGSSTGGSGTGSGTGGTGGGSGPPPSGSFSVAWDGDWGTSSGTKDTVSNILNFSEVTKTVVLGDISYEKTSSKWKDITAKLRQDGRTMDWCVGNHDADDASGLIGEYHKIFGTSKTYHSFTVGPMYVLVGDMYTKFDKGSTQYNFLKGEMEKMKNNSSIYWRVMIYHEPLYGSKSKHSNNPDWRDIYHPLMDANNFDLGINGHNHHYERTYPLRYNNGSPSSPNKATANDPNYTNPDGVIFITCGLGGHDVQYKISSETSWSAASNDSTFGFLETTMSGNKLTGKAYKNGSHSQFDVWSITKK